MIYFFILGLLAIQRLLEMRIGKKNLLFLEDKLVLPLDQNEKKQMLLLHSFWFICTGAEFYFHGKIIEGPWFVGGILILMLTQYVRYLSMKHLGIYWVPYPVAFIGQKIIETGPYRFMRHPNYLAVIIEVALVPLMGRAYLSAGFFSLINLIFLKRRVEMEERALAGVENFVTR
jgi:methyltransferase